MVSGAVCHHGPNDRFCDPPARLRPAVRPCYHRAAMPDRPESAPERYYVTTAIAYANNKPGLHTLYEVIAADALARWQRMRGVPTRFLTGTDEHCVNIAERAAEEGVTPKAFVDEQVAKFRAAEDALLISPGPLHPDDRPRPRPIRPGDGPPGACGRRHLRRHVRGLVLPERGLPQPHRRRRDRRRDDLPEPSRGPAPVAHGAELVLPPLGLPGAPRALVRGAPRLRPARLPAQRDARLHPRRPRGLLDQPGRGRVGDPVPGAPRRVGRAAARRDLGPGRRHDLRLVRRAHQLHHRRRLPRRPGAVRPLVAGRPARHRQGHRPLPHDLLAGDALVARVSRRRAASGSTAGSSPRASG